MARNGKCVYPYPVYEGHFADGSVVRMSFWTPINKPIDFTIGQIHCELYKLAPVIDGFVERDEPGKPWGRIRDPHFSGEPVKTVKPRVNGAKLKKAALAVIEAVVIDHPDGGLPMVTHKVLRDLREALNLAA